MPTISIFGILIYREELFFSVLLAERTHLSVLSFYSWNYDGLWS